MLDQKTIQALTDALVDKAGIRGKKTITQTESNNLDRLLRTFPGEFRTHVRHLNDKKNKSFQDLADFHNTDVDTILTILYRGNERAIEKYRRGESNMNWPNRGVPGTSRGIDFTDMSISPS